MSVGPLPEHHRQWFQQLKLAAANDDLALMSCTDAATGEQRSVICIAQREEDSVSFIPLGHLATGDSPYDDYIPATGEAA